jgi:hypothetical protein
MERIMLSRIKFLFSRCRNTIDAYKKRAEKDGNVEGLNSEAFQTLLNKLDEMEVILNG